MTEGTETARNLWRGPILAWGVLLLLFAISLGSAFVPLGIGNVVLNLFIAAVMAVVLVIFLMDLRNSRPLVRVAAVSGLFWTVLMFSLMFSDYLTRN